jgi:hypothetical protein
VVVDQEPCLGKVSTIYLLHFQTDLWTCSPASLWRDEHNLTPSCSHRFKTQEWNVQRAARKRNNPCRLLRLSSELRNASWNERDGSKSDGAICRDQLVSILALLNSLCVCFSRIQNAPGANQSTRRHCCYRRPYHHDHNQQSTDCRVGTIVPRRVATGPVRTQ